MRRLLNFWKQFIYTILTAFLIAIVIIGLFQPLPYMILKLSSLWSNL